MKEQIYKLPDRAESQRVWNYPLRALEESIVNSLYHRSWEIREPVEIRILPDCIEIINQGGPDRSVKMDEIRSGVIHNRRYRNRRIGDFLKELDMTEGRGTGIPIIRKEMRNNGSSEPRFETDDNYSYFITTLPIHPAFVSSGGVDGGVNGGVEHADIQSDKLLNLLADGSSGGVDDGVKNIVSILLNVSGLNAGEIATRTDRSLRTTERYLQLLRKKGVIEFRGIPRTGGYHLTDEAKHKLE